MITISNRKNEFQKNEKVSLINSKFINYLLIRRLKNNSNLFSICYKNIKMKDGNFWKVDTFNDINTLNEDSLWAFGESSKGKKKEMKQNKLDEKVYLVGVSIQNKKELNN